MLLKIEGYKDLRVSDNIDLTLGGFCHFNGMVIHNDGFEKCGQRLPVKIGDHFHCGKRCLIRTSDHDFHRGYPMVHGSLAGYAVAGVEIGDYVWFGDDILVMKGIRIGSGAIIQARSVVVSDIPELAIAGGHPCRVFSHRNPEDFEFFKNLGMSRVRKEKIDAKKVQFESSLAAYREGKQGGEPKGD